MEKYDKMPKWLKRVQENSWELELLISGGAIFSLFKLSDFFQEFALTIRITNVASGLHLFTVFGMYGIKLLTIGFITHLLIRAYWVGQVCLNFAFPNGVLSRKEVSKKTPFKDVFESKDNLKSDLLEIDSIAGIALFLSIILTYLLVGFLISLIPTLTIPSLLFKNFGSSFLSAYANVLFVIYLIYILDLVLFGLLRRVPYISYVLYPFFIALDYLTLRFFIQKPLRVYSSNINKKIISTLLIFFFSMALILTYTSIYKIMKWLNILDQRNYRNSLAKNWLDQELYLDQYDKDAIITRPVIQSQIITGSFLKLYFPYFKDYDYLIEQYITSKEYTYPSDMLIVYLDDKEVESIDWFNYRGFKNSKIGLQTLIDISSLNKGKHILRLESVGQEVSYSMIFWKE